LDDQVRSRQHAKHEVTCIILVDAGLPISLFCHFSGDNSC